MGITRLEMNLRRLLAQCEKLAKDDQRDWRLEKYIDALDDMAVELQKLPNKPNKDTISEYVRRIVFLKGVMETQKLENPAEKVVAVQLLSRVSNSSEITTKEIHQKTTSKYNNELRDQLFQTDKGSDNELRQRKQTNEDLDVLLKYHQSMQEKIADDMLTLARSLKEQSQLAGKIIQADTVKAEKSSDQADKNLHRLKIESERLAEQSRKAWKCWIWLIIVIVITIFMSMVLFMKVMKKKKKS